MSSTRSIISPPPFAANALTVIPPTPVAGVSYRDPVAGPASSADGWPYAERVNSAEWNQIMYQLSSLVSIMDKKGVLGWSSAVDYTEAGVQFGSDGILYSWLAASGPNNGGAKDPILNPSFWRKLQAGQLIGVQVFSSVGAATYIPTTGTTSIVVEVQGGGGAGGGSQATAAGTISVSPGGNAGANGRSRITTGFSGVTITVGAGGTGVLGANGNAGGASSFGAAISAPGGQGGVAYPAATPPVLNINGTAQTSSTGGNIINAPGGRGLPGIASGVTFGGSGDGGSSVYGAGGPAAGAISSPTNGKAGVSPGSGGSGGAGGAGAGASTGGNGAPGIVIVQEYA